MREAGFNPVKGTERKGTRMREMPDEDPLSAFSEWGPKQIVAIIVAILVSGISAYNLGFTTGKMKDECVVHDRFAFVTCERDRKWNLDEITQVDMPHEPGAKEKIACTWNERRFWGTEPWPIDKPVCRPHTMIYPK
jgi:hypothetical protein